MYDIIIVGGGPSGCFTGKLLAEQGFDVAIIEEHAEIGYPICCAGIVGVGGLKELGIKPGKWVLNKLKGAIFYPPSGKPVEITRGRVEAFVIDRGTFDQELAIAAVKAGAIILMKTRCVGLKMSHKPTVKVKDERGKSEIGARLIVGADGPFSIIAREAGLAEPSRYASSAQVELFADVKPDNAEVYLGRKFAPGYFAWIVATDHICRVGLGTSKGLALPKLFDLIQKHPIVSKKVDRRRVLHLTTGVVPEPFSRKIYSDRVMLVGDAAAHLKPLTGGGIYMGLSCAKLAVEVATRALDAEPTEKILREYELALRKKFGHELELELRARKLFQKLSDKDLDFLFELLSEPQVKALLLKHGDFDHHGALLKILIKKGPSLLRLMGLRKFTRYLRILTN